MCQIIDGPADGVTVSGMVFGLPPVKTSPQNVNFFNAKHQDGQKWSHLQKSMS